MIALKKQEWIDRCATRYMRHGGVGETLAREMAATCWDEEQDNPTSQSPEDCADEDMSYWTDDE